MAGRKTSVYLSEQLAAQVEESGLTLAEIIRRGLAAGEPEPLEDTLRRIMRDELSEWQGSELSEDESRPPVCDRCGTELACPQCYRGEG